MSPVQIPLLSHHLQGQSRLFALWWSRMAFNETALMTFASRHHPSAAIWYSPHSMSNTSSLQTCLTDKCTSIPIKFSQGYQLLHLLLHDAEMTTYFLNLFILTTALPNFWYSLTSSFTAGKINYWTCRIFLSWSISVVKKIYAFFICMFVLFGCQQHL